MDKLDQLNYKWFWISGIIGFIIGVFWILFGFWKMLAILALTGLGLVIGFVVDILLTREKGKIPEPDEDEEE